MRAWRSSSKGKGRHSRSLTCPTSCLLFPQLVDSHAGRLAEAAHGEQEHPGAIALIFLNRVIVPAENFVKFIPDFQDDVFRFPDVDFLRPLGLGVDERRGEIAHAYRLVRVQRQGIIVLRQELVDIALFRVDDRLDDVGQVEAVQVDHHRQQDAPVFGDAEGADDVIEGLLAVFDE